MSRSSVARWVGVLRHAVVVGTLYTALFSLFFLPALAKGKLLAPGDGLVQNLPLFLLRPTLWTSMLFGGYPLFADPQNLFYYPLRWLFSPLGAWNAFVLSAFVVAALAMYGYVLRVTASRLAGLTAGLVYSMSGFFVAQLGHVNMLHTVAWLPLVVWSVDELRRGSGPGWIAVGSLSIACAALAGHPQMLLYTLGLSGAFAAAHVAAAGERRWRLLRDLGAMFGAGLAVAAVQLLPSYLLAGETIRSEISYETFVEFSFPPSELPRLLFPFAYGHYSTGSFFGVPYFGGWSLAETTGFVGSLGFLLAVVAAASRQSRRLVLFWEAIIAASLLLAFGDGTPLARVMHHVPVYRGFRCPARHFLEMTFAVALLAGLGVAFLERGTAEARRLAGRAVAGVLALYAAGAGALALLGTTLAEKALAAGLKSYSVLPWKNPAVGLPLALAAASAVGVLLLVRRPASPAARAVLLLVAVFDLAAFGWVAEWRYYSPDRATLDFPAAVEPFREQVLASGKRHHAVGEPIPPEGLTPNLNRLWRIPSVTGYTPLRLRRNEQVMPWNDIAVLGAENHAIDILGAGWVFVGGGLTSHSSITERDGFRWGENLDVTLEPGKQQSVEWLVPGSPPFSDVGFVAALANGASLPDGSLVATVDVEASSGKKVSLPLRAGIEVSEWAYGRPDLASSIRHAKARVWETMVQEERPGEKYEAFFFLGASSLGERLRVKALSVRLEPSTPASLILRKVALRDNETWTFHSVRLLSPRGDRFRFLGSLGSGSFFENRRVRPRAWLVPEVRTLASDQVVEAVRTSVLPAGETFDPARHALLEQNVPFFNGGDPDPDATVEVVRAREGRIKLRTWSRRPAFLVLGESTYPGWKVRVDRQAERLYVVDHVLQGLPLSAGRHEVTFRFDPWSFWTGAGISVLSLLCLALFVRHRRRHPSPGRWEVACAGLEARCLARLGRRTGA
jgi:hypothetical protein